MSRRYKKTYRKMKSVYKNVELDRKPFPKPLLILIICAAAFVAAFFAIRQLVKVYNESKVEPVIHETASLGKGGKQPEIFMKSAEGKLFNRLSGNKGEEFLKQERGESLIPLTNDRKQTIVIDLPKSRISKVSYQVRNSGSGDLIEETDIENLTEEGGRTEAVIEIKDLLSDKRPYNLQIRLETADGAVSLYNTTVELLGDVWAKEKLDYVANLSGMLYDPSKSEEVYEEFFPLSETDGTNFAKAGYNSLTSLLMWEGLSAKKLEDPIPSIVKIDEESTKITQSYPIELTASDEKVSRVIVNEVYSVRMTNKGEVVLVNFNRDAYETLEKPGVIDAAINLGFQADEDVNVTASENAKYTAFVNGGNLWLLEAGSDANRSKFTKVFSLDLEDGSRFDKAKEIRVNDEGDITQINGDYGINILSVDNEGGVKFTVYGTYPGGFTKGETGISVFRYDNANKKLFEAFFIEETGEFEEVKKKARESYLNDNGEFFTVSGSSLFRTEGENLKTDQVVEGLSDSPYSVSDKGSAFAVAQISKENKAVADKIITYDCNANATKEITSANGEGLILIGHTDEDLVYGKGALENVVGDKFYMDEIRVVDKDGKEKISYKNEGIYYSDVSVYDNGIKYKEFSRDGEAGFKEIKEGRIVAKDEEKNNPFNVYYETETGKRKQLKIGFESYVNTDDGNPLIITECDYMTR